MKILKNITLLGLPLLMIFFAAGCTNDEPIRVKDFSTLRLGRMDLSGAVSIGLKTNDSSRAIDGEYQSAGLYKIDKNGNISAVGVYFTTDSLGNRQEKEYALRVAPEAVFHLTSNYILAIMCDYYDSDGDFVNGVWNENSEEWINQSVPYKDLLVRISDGKIWCVDNIGEYLYSDKYNLCGNFKEDSKGNLYQYDLSNLYRFDLSSYYPVYEQINTRYIGFRYPNKWDISTNGVVWGEGWDGFEFNWPKSGFQTIELNDKISDDYSFIVPDEIKNKNVGMVVSVQRTQTHVVSFLHNPVWIAFPSATIYQEGHEGYQCEYFADDNLLNYARERVPLALVYYSSIGDVPGTAKVCDNPIAIYNAPEELVNYDSYYRQTFTLGGQDSKNSISYLLIDNNIYAFFANYGKTWISRIDLEKRSWEWIKEIDEEFNVEDNFYYNGKYWIDKSIPENNYYGVMWLDPISLEVGIVQFNVNIPDYYPYMEWESSGRVSWKGQNPANGNYEKIVVNLETGEVLDSSSNAPDLLFETIISLN